MDQIKISLEEQQILINKKFYGTFEIDDHLLGKFEDIGSFEKKNLLDIDDVYGSFDWYINIIWNNEEIRKYISNQIETENDGDDIYENSKYITYKCGSYGEAKLANKWIWWWKIRCYFF